MYELSYIVSKIITGILSILDSSNLRTLYYSQKEEHEIMWTALDDIARMHKGHSSAELAQEALSKIKVKYGR